MKDVALFALLRNKSPHLYTLPKELSWLKLPSSKRGEPVLGAFPSASEVGPEVVYVRAEAFDAQALSDYIKTKAAVLSEEQQGIQRSSSEASLFFQNASEEKLQLLTYTRRSPQRSPLKNTIRRGLMMLPGNVVVMKAAQSERRQQIGFGVKSSAGHRPHMEDSHIIKPSFFRFPISLSCSRQLIPEFVESELAKGSPSDQNEDICSWRTFKSEMTSRRDASVPCVFDEFDLFLVCDGHGGAQVAQYCTANFKNILRTELKASVEEKYLELLQSEQTERQELSTTALAGLPERSAKSAASLGDSPRPKFLDIVGRRKLKFSESVRVRGSADLHDASERSATGPQGAQCGLDAERLGDCLVRSFQQLDSEVKERKLGDFEGTTALAALVGSWHICVANCGDSRAVLSRNGVAMRLTRDHKPHIEEERQRIEQQGGFVLNAYGCSRVNGFLAMSRAIGDHLIPSVIAQPDVTILHRNALDEFLICATDGLWDVMTDEEACDMTRKCLARAEAKGARKLSTRVAANVLLKAALDKGSTDNITIAVVDLRIMQKSKA